MLYDGERAQTDTEKGAERASWTAKLLTASEDSPDSKDSSIVAMVLELLSAYWASPVIATLSGTGATGSWMTASLASAGDSGCEPLPSPAEPPLLIFTLLPLMITPPESMRMK